MTGQKPTPGRYAQDASGVWHLFTDKAALSFKPVAIVTVKAPAEKPPFKLGISRAPGSAACPAPDPAPESIITIAKPGGGHVGIVVGDTGAAVLVKKGLDLGVLTFGLVNERVAVFTQRRPGGRIENLFFDRGVNGQLGGDLDRQRALHERIARGLCREEGVEKHCRIRVVGLEQSDSHRRRGHLASNQ